MTTTRTCPSCGEAFTVPARIPYKRYCSPRCRAASHRRRTRAKQHVDGNPDRHAVTNEAANDVPNDVASANGVTNGVTNSVTNAGNDTPNGVHAANGNGRCPHCHQPIAVIATLVPPHAARVRTPEVIRMHPD